MSTVEGAAVHRPRYQHCPDPEDCCYTYGPLAIRCAVDGEDWPCSTKRSHHTEQHAARLERWVENRIERAMVLTSPDCDRGEEVRDEPRMYEVTGRVGDREAEPATMHAGQLAEITVVGDSAPVLTISDWETASVDSAATTTGQWRALVSGLYEIIAGQPPRLLEAASEE